MFSPVRRRSSSGGIRLCVFSPVWHRSSSGGIRLCYHLYGVVVLLVVYDCVLTCTAS